jgi:hypothetical protein
MATAGLVRAAPRPMVAWGIVIAGCAGVAGSVALALTSDHVSEPGLHAALINWATLSFVLTGVVAWVRRPESRFGPLMIAAGTGSFLSSLSSANAAAIYTLGIAFDLVAAVLFLHVFLAFPTAGCAAASSAGSSRSRI